MKKYHFIFDIELSAAGKRDALDKIVEFVTSIKDIGGVVWHSGYTGTVYLSPFPRSESMPLFKQDGELHLLNFDEEADSNWPAILNMIDIHIEMWQKYREQCVQKAKE